MNMNCDNCYNKFKHNTDSFCYLNENLSMSGICDGCYHHIDSKLVILVNISKIESIKRKAHKLMLQRNSKV